MQELHTCRQLIAMEPLPPALPQPAAPPVAPAPKPASMEYLLASMAARDSPAHSEDLELALSPTHSAGGNKNIQRRRRRHPVAEIKGGWTAEEDAKLRE